MSDNKFGEIFMRVRPSFFNAVYLTVFAFSVISVMYLGLAINGIINNNDDTTFWSSLHAGIWFVAAIGFYYAELAYEQLRAERAQQKIPVTRHVEPPVMSEGSFATDTEAPDVNPIPDSYHQIHGKQQRDRLNNIRQPHAHHRERPSSTETQLTTNE